MPDLKQFRLPDVGEGLTEADILTWSVAPGDRVVVNQTLVEVETAKAAVELPSPFAGVVAALHAAEGETVEVGRPIITIDIAPQEAAPQEAAPQEAAPQETAPGRDSASGNSASGNSGPGNSAASPRRSNAGGRGPAGSGARGLRAQVRPGPPPDPPGAGLPAGADPDRASRLRGGPVARRAGAQR